MERKNLTVYFPSCAKASHFEVYYRNDISINHYSTETATVKYTFNTVAKSKDQERKEKSWFEVSIFWDIFESLLTGGLTGSKKKQMT